MNRDHLADAINGGDAGDISNSLAHSSIASVETLRSIESRLGELVKFAAAAVGVLLDTSGVDEQKPKEKLDVDEPVPYTPAIDAEANRSFRAEQLGDHLHAVYDSATTAPFWPILGAAALDWMEKNNG